MGTESLHYDDLTGLGDPYACLDYLDTCVKNGLPHFRIIFSEIS